MSTSNAFLQEDNTSGAIQDSEQWPSFRYSHSGTDNLSVKDPKILPRSTSQEYIRVIHNQLLKEDIKQRWTGVILDVDDDDVTVELEDLDNRENPPEQVVFSKSEFDDNDQYLIMNGAQLYWYIGYRKGPRYRRESFSIIRMRRFPKWTKREIEEAETLAEEYTNFFKSS